jgi:multiple sugar transport system substrate-binding protein
MEQSRFTKKLATGAAVLLAVAACQGGASPAPTGGGGSTAGTGSSAPGETTAASNACGTDPITLNIWGGYPEIDPAYKQAGEDFKKTHPNVSFTVFSTDLRGFEQKLTTALPSKTAGEVVIRTTNFLSRFIDQGLLDKLPDDIKTAVRADGAYAPEVVKDNTYKDDIWGMPIFTGGTGIYYNTDDYAAAGITSPPASLDDLAANARKLAVKDSSGTLTRSGWSLRLSGQGSGVAEKFWILLIQKGKTLIRETPEGSGKWVAEYNGPEGQALFQMYVDLLKEGVDSQNIEHDAKAFETHQTSQFLRESWVINEIATTAPDLVGHYATVSPPVGDILTTESMFVPADAQNKDCAWDFVRFMREPAQQQNLTKVSGWLFARKDVDLTDFLKANPTYEGFLKHPDNYQLYVTPPIPEFDEIETKLATHLVDGYADYENLSGKPDAIKALLDGWAQETNDILKANGHYGG